MVDSTATLFRLIVNPVAGRGRAIRAADRLQKALEARGAVTARLTTTAPGDLERRGSSWMQQHRQAACTVLLGGDGTVHEFVQVLAEVWLRDQDTPVWTVLPCGTGNTLGREFCAERNPERLASRLLEDLSRNTEQTERPPENTVYANIPLARARAGSAQRWFVLFAGIGLDASAIQSLEDARKSRPLRTGRFAWAQALWRIWAPWSPPEPFDVSTQAESEVAARTGTEHQQRTHRKGVHQVLATRVRHYGGVIPLPVDRGLAERPEFAVFATAVRGRFHAVSLGLRGLCGLGLGRTQVGQVCTNQNARPRAGRSSGAATSSGIERVCCTVQRPTPVHLDGTVWLDGSTLASGAIELTVTARHPSVRLWVSNSQAIRHVQTQPRYPLPDDRELP